MRRLDPIWDPVFAVIALLAIMFWWKYFVWVLLVALLLAAAIWKLPWEWFLYRWLREKQETGQKQSR